MKPTIRRRSFLHIVFAAALTLLPTVAAAEQMTNGDVLKLHAAGFGEGVIIDKIRTTEPGFDTSVEALIRLKEMGVPQAVLLEILQASGPDESAAEAEPAEREFAFKRIEGRNWFARYNMLQGEYANVTFDYRGVRWVHTKGNLRGEETVLPWRYITRICYAPRSGLPSIKIFASTGSKYRLNPSTWDGDPDGRAREVMSYLLRAKEVDFPTMANTIVNLECK